MTHHDDDPLSRAIAPPPNETAEEKAARLATEREARRVSDEIDQRLHNEKVDRKNRKIVKVLLLGQSESGKHIPEEFWLPSFFV